MKQTDFQSPLGLLDQYTHRGNLKETRYGWLRLTPAYSVHLVSKLLSSDLASDVRVLDPFCGTGTTALVCAEYGLACDTTDINPFLIWLTRAKTQSYSAKHVDEARSCAARVRKAILSTSNGPYWVPPLHQIEKWWDAASLEAFGRAILELRLLGTAVPNTVVDLLKVAFCRALIERANVSFGHQSMSFSKVSKDGPMLKLLYSSEDFAAESWDRAIASVITAARSTVRTSPGIHLCDARDLGQHLERDYYTHVVTSPPYPNRMSYIRELRPYMYWLEYLHDGRAAGELDWKAIGGTWGCATSNLLKWQADSTVEVPFDGFHVLIQRIAQQSLLLARYVQKYFYDMLIHCRELYDVVRPDGVVHYIVGNSKFYDVVLPVESIFAELFASVGFKDVRIERIRKRTSKSELFEFSVSARKT